MKASAVVVGAFAAAALVLLRASPESRIQNPEPSPEPRTQNREPAASEILTRAGAYVHRFEEAFAVVVADEFYRQDLDDEGWPAGRGRGRRRTHRDIRSEVLFMWTPRDTAWLTVRNVLMFRDGAAAWAFARDSRDRIEAILGRTAVDQEERFRTLANESARFNIGRVYRNLAMPTMTIQFVDPRYQPRFEFADAGPDDLRQLGATRKLSFVERSKPTVIRSAMHDLMSSGTIWVLPADGAVVRTRLALVVPPEGRDPALEATVQVDYRREPAFGVWVPAQMTESYREQIINGETIACTATYSNFRRFDTSARVVPPK